MEDGSASTVGPVYEGYGCDGSDLYIASSSEYAERLKNIKAYLEEAAKKKAQGAPRCVQEDSSIEAAAEQIRSELGARFAEMSQTDKLYAQAIRDWTSEELRRRETAGDTSYDARSAGSYIEIMKVLDMLIAELETEGEDDTLIEVARVWRLEAQAELCIVTYRELYQLAA